MADTKNINFCPLCGVSVPFKGKFCYICGYDLNDYELSIQSKINLRKSAVQKQAASQNPFIEISNSEKSVAQKLSDNNLHRDEKAILSVNNNTSANKESDKKHFIILILVLVGLCIFFSQGNTLIKMDDTVNEEETIENNNIAPMKNNISDDLSKNDVNSHDRKESLQKQDMTHPQEYDKITATQPKQKNVEQVQSVQIPSGEHWIKDNNDVYIWNPRPEVGESITWSGDFVQDGAYRYADGFGITIWYKYGEIIQIDKGNFERGQRHGKFEHKFFPSGNVVYSYWEHGKEIR